MQRSGSQTLRVTPALLELRRNTWRGAADVEDVGIHGMTFKHAGRRGNPLKCEGILLGTRVFTCRSPLETLTQTEGDVKRRWIAFGRRVFTCRRP